LSHTHTHNKVKVKVKLSLQAYWGSGSMAPRILNLDARWRWTTDRILYRDLSAL